MTGLGVSERRADAARLWSLLWENRASAHTASPLDSLHPLFLIRTFRSFMVKFVKKQKFTRVKLMI